MVYDVGELSEYKLGENKTAAAIGAYTFGMGIAQAIGYSAIGYILAAAGFDATAAVQSEEAVNAIIYTQTIVPVIFMVVSGIVIMMLYKINSGNHKALVEALAAKKAGKEHSEEGFRELL